MTDVHASSTFDLRSNISSFQFNPDSKLQQRLGLYQVFLKLYEQHPGLLDEILGLEHSGSKLLHSETLPYLQGMVLGKQIYLITNLIRGRTQILSQPQNIWTIGRDSRRVVLTVADKRLSRCHAAIYYCEHQGFQLVDLGSSNGSFINGEFVKQTARLKDGDRIRLGSLTFSFFASQTSQELGLVPPEIVSQIQSLVAPKSDRAKVGSSTCRVSDPTSKETSNLSLDDTLLFMRDQAESLPSVP